MTIPIMQGQREQLMLRAKRAVEDDKLEEFDKIKTEITQIDKRISAQQFVDSAKLSKAKEPSDRLQSNRIANEYDLGKALRCAMSGRFDGLEGEVQAELRSKPGNNKHVANAVLVPDELLHTRAVTAGTVGDNTLTESFRPQEFLPVLRDRSIAMSLGARGITGLGDKIRIPRQGAATSASWQSETSAVTATDMAFLSPIELEAHRISYHTSHSDQIIRESGGGLPIQRLIIEEAQRAMADKVDSSIFATNTTQETNAPTQLWKVGTVGSIAARARTGDTNGKAVSYDDILELAGSSADANLPMMRSGFAINFKTQRKLKQLRKLTGSTDSMTVFQNGTIDGYPTQISNRVTDNFSKGTGTVSVMFYSSDWQYLVIATWGSTALIIDPYTKADESTVRLIWHQFMDWGILRDSAFSWYDSVLLT